MVTKREGTDLLTKESLTRKAKRHKRSGELQYDCTLPLLTLELYIIQIDWMTHHPTTTMECPLEPLASQTLYGSNSPAHRATISLYSTSTYTGTITYLCSLYITQIEVMTHHRTTTRECPLEPLASQTFMALTHLPTELQYDCILPLLTLELYIIQIDWMTHHPTTTRECPHEPLASQNLYGSKSPAHRATEPLEL
ncbi:hypothetical protein J6590_085072 [Homalodisca vitripennis]|nr:hypothetical protein J6590_085072 [Homalodisca vitripennis]